MSCYVTLLRDKDNPVYQKYLKILMACKAADIDPPPEVDRYFGGDGIDNDPEAPLEIDFTPKDWSDGDCEDFEFSLNELPEGVDRIRVYAY